VGDETGLEAVDWSVVVKTLAGPGWIRLQSAIGARTCSRLIDAAPGTWSPLQETEGPGGHVRQGGVSCHVEVAHADPIVRSFAQSICDAINVARSPEVPLLPSFNDVQWGASKDGVGYITPHRDPPGAGGAIATVTLRGQARFHVWDDRSDLPPAQHRHTLGHEWETGDGDLVLLRGGGWPTHASRCPVHEAESPVIGDRMTLTLRHNRSGYGGNYFA
jgi:hypothetical protein